MAQMRKPRYANAVNQAAAFARELDGLIVSVDVSTGDHDIGARVFGQIYSAQADEERDASVTLLAEAIEDNRSPDPLRELAEWLVSLDEIKPGPEEYPVPMEEIIIRAREALGQKED